MVGGPHKCRDEDYFETEVKNVVEKPIKRKIIKPCKSARVIYAGSFDPIHNGHIDVITRAAKTFEELEVAVGNNSAKKYSFTLEERADIARKVLANIPNVQVTSFNGLLTRYASQQGIHTIVKGIRDYEDFKIEALYHRVGESQNSEIETVLFIAKPELEHVSSSAVKILQQEHGDIHEYVPLSVKQKLEERISGQYFVGITGETGSGKSYVGERLVELGKEKGLEVHNIELDLIGHQILGHLRKHKEARENIIREFGEEVKLIDGSINRKLLRKIVFADKRKLDRLNQYMHKPILLELQEALYGKKGLILVNSALLAETDTLYLCNNNVIMITADEITRVDRLKSRGFNEQEIYSVTQLQDRFEEKQRKIIEAIKRENHGSLWVIDNSKEKRNEEISNAFNKIIEKLCLR
jgi:pantetheine-phosphate adenylyltransferase